MIITLLAGCSVGITIPGEPGEVVGKVLIRQGSMLDLQAEDVLLAATNEDPYGFEPLPYAEVEIVGARTWDTKRTNAEGHYRFGGLPPGTYTITVRHEALRFEVKREKVRVYSGRRTEVPSIHTGIGHYIVIGIDRYQDGTTSDGAVEAAEAVFNKLFRQNRLAGMGRLLLNNRRDVNRGIYPARKSEIKAAVEEAIRMASSEADYLVIYFAGVAKMDYLRPWDASGQYGNIITDGELESWVKGFPGNVTLIIDGSYAGSWADDPILEPLAFRKSRYTLLGAAQWNEVASYDWVWGQRVFTYFLLQGLEDGNADLRRPYGEITASELYDYIYEEMWYYFDAFTEPDSHEPAFHEGEFGDTVIFRY
ncbi:MAG TPA: carboxypeptidase regulatory-like domain-containing protein [Limnochordia bacterium]|nr:carboxypeptidase regulatory-like domain-containing protein [Limnochordia bacterium]